MAKVYSVKAKELFSAKTIRIDITTNNDGAVLFITPSEKDRKMLLRKDLKEADNLEEAWRYWGKQKLETKQP
jgi:hypothetical protein